MHLKQALTAIINVSDLPSGNINTPITMEQLTRDLTAASKQFSRYAELIENAISETVKQQHMHSKAFWGAIMNITKAAIITGADSIPDVPFPKLKDLHAHDRLAEIEKFGFRVLRAAEAKGGKFYA